MSKGFEQIESNQRQFHFEMEHNARLELIFEQKELFLFSTIRPKLFEDGNSWCCLYGDNIQEGVAGFGNSPIESIYNWIENMKKPNINSHE